MKLLHQKQLAMLLSALLLVCPLTACGQEESTNLTAADNSVSDESGEAEDESTDSEEETSDTDEEGSEADSNSKSEKTDSSKSESSTASKKKKNDSSAAESSAGASGGNTSSGGNTPSGGNASSGGNTASGGNASSGGNTASGGNASSGNAPDEEDDVDPEDAEKPTKYIYLQGASAQYSGDGINVNGGLITISKGGTYEISGTLSNGQIYIQTDKKKVKLHFNGVSISNAAGSAINCQSAKKVTIKTLPGTVNYLEDGGTHDADKGTIFSEDTVVLKGDGVLNITAHYAHGIQSDDDIVMNGGTVHITSTKSGLHSNDGIEINGGALFCDGGTNGIKTDGYVIITGGNSVFLGGTREEKGAIYCDGSFTVTGGTFRAIGNTCTMPDASTTTANVIGVTFANTQPANSLVNISGGGYGILTMTSPRNYKYVVYCGPELTLNTEYFVNYGGTANGASIENYVYYGGSYTGANDGGSFTAGNTVTLHTVS